MRRGVWWCAAVASAALSLALFSPGELSAESATGAQELARRGGEALEAGRYADAVSLLRLSYSMEAQAETMCRLAEAFERWGGHDQEAMESYRRCAAEDRSGRLVRHATERALALQSRLSGGGGAAPTPPGVTPVTVSWSNVRSTSGCFFFSGPGDLGRRERLGTSASWTARGDQVALSFGGALVFTGQRSGQSVTLTRRSTHQYNGPWIITETIQGAFVGDTLHGVYQYQECDGQRPAACPGRCTIQAQLSARPAP